MKKANADVNISKDQCKKQNAGINISKDQCKKQNAVKIDLNHVFIEIGLKIKFRL